MFLMEQAAFGFSRCQAAQVFSRGRRQTGGWFSGLLHRCLILEQHNFPPATLILCAVRLILTLDRMAA
jgi:hypothetical protein